MATPVDRYTDLDFDQGEDDALFDLIIDPDTKDFAVTDGLEAAILTSVFSDRRARDDEVRDPMKRRGWIGNTVAEVPGDNFGSGLWLYEQKRLSSDVAVGLRNEAQQSLDWMVDQDLISHSSASIVAVPDRRQTYLTIKLFEPGGGATERAYRLADATRNGRLVTLGDQPPIR